MCSTDYNEMMSGGIHLRTYKTPDPPPEIKLELRDVEFAKDDGVPRGWLVGHYNLEENYGKGIVWYNTLIGRSAVN
jgi:hypothetical protein